MIHLHVHDSEGSLLDSTVRPEELPFRAKELGMNAVAITNHGNMTSSIKFYKACLEHGIKPLIGCEMYVCSDLSNRDNDNRYDHLVVIARNKKGYENLLKLVTISHLEGMFYKPRIDMKTLLDNSEGLIVTTACLGGEIPKLILKKNTQKAIDKILEYKSKLEYFFLEVQGADNEEQELINKELSFISDLVDVPLVATCDVHFLKKEDFTAHGVFIQINQDRDNEFYQDCWLKSEQEVFEVLNKHIGFENSLTAISNTHMIADLCEDRVIEIGKSYLPHFPIPPVFNNEDDYLKHLVNLGFKTRNLDKLPKKKLKKYVDRAKYEFDIICKKGFSGYFLIVADFLERCRKANIYLGDGRGSADNSLVCYLLHITNVDPILYKLNFGRFLTMERTELPDIDLDLQSSRKQDGVTILRELYGFENVAQVANVQTLQAKAVMDAVGKVLGYHHKDVESIKKFVPDQTSLAKALELKGSSKLRELREEHKELFDMCLKLEGLPRSLSTHAGGVVICPADRKMNEFTALTLSKKKEIITQLNKKDIEVAGLVKMDVLATTTLDVIADTLDLVYGEI